MGDRVGVGFAGSGRGRGRGRVRDRARRGELLLERLRPPARCLELAHALRTSRLVRGRGRVGGRVRGRSRGRVRVRGRGRGRSRLQLGVGLAQLCELLLRLEHARLRGGSYA